jgi:hypothetical protein
MRLCDTLVTCVILAAVAVLSASPGRADEGCAIARAAAKALCIPGRPSPLCDSQQRTAYEVCQFEALGMACGQLQKMVPGAFENPQYSDQREACEAYAKAKGLVATEQGAALSR